jgi:hypothetical protein
MLRWSAVVVIVLGCAAACGSPTDRPTPAITNGTDARSSPQPLPTPRIPRHTRLYTSIPKACSLMNAQTLRVLAPGARGLELDPTPAKNVTTRTCNWHVEKNAQIRSLLITAHLISSDEFSGPAKRAEGEFQRLVREQSDIDKRSARPIIGLGDEAQLSATEKPFRQTHLRIRSQNVLLTIVYNATDNGRSLELAALNDRAIAAGRAVLLTLAAR